MKHKPSKAFSRNKIGDNVVVDITCCKWKTRDPGLIQGHQKMHFITPTRAVMQQDGKLILFYYEGNSKRVTGEWLNE